MSSRQETKEERERRRAEKSRKVQQHRAGILQKVNKGAAGTSSQTTATGGATSSSQAGLSKLHKREEDFLCPVHFDNTLPELPAEQKYVAYPFDEDFITAYDILHGLSSETNQPRIYHPEPDLDIVIPLIDPETYTIPSHPVPLSSLHPLDADIISNNYARPAVRRTDSTIDHAKVEWLMLSQHLHNDLYDAVYKHGDMVANQAAHIAKKQNELKQKVIAGGTRQERIENSFNVCKSNDIPLVHPSNPKLEPVKVWDVLPIPDAGGIEYIAVNFDADPDDISERKLRKLPTLSPGVRHQRLTHGLLKAVNGQDVDMRDRMTTTQLLLPLAEDMANLSIRDTTAAASTGDKTDSFTNTGTDGGLAAVPLRYEIIRDYSMFVDSGEKIESVGIGTVGGGEENFAFVWDDIQGCVYYAPVKKRATITRLKARFDATSTTHVDAVVHRRTLRPEELDQLEEWRAKIDENDPSETLEKIQERRQARLAAIRTAANTQKHHQGSQGSSQSFGSQNSMDIDSNGTHALNSSRANNSRDNMNEDIGFDVEED